MWLVRVLSGPLAGKFIELKTGRNLVGRGSHCQVALPSLGVSKEHCEIQVYADKIMIVDLQSSNGTYLNGVRIQNGIVKVGDKVGVHDVLFDITPQAPIQPALPSPQNQFPQPHYGNLALDLQAQRNLADQALGYSGADLGLSSQPPPAPLAALPQNPVAAFLQQAQSYMERVALPGVYKIAELTEFKMVLGGFIGLFIFFVTVLSMFPMMQITKDSITAESMRRAMSLARTMAQVNRQAILTKNFSGMDTHMVEVEEGVKLALIIDQADGSILAPSSRLGQGLDLPFAVKTRREGKSLSELIDSNTIGASFPIDVYDPETGEAMIRAYSLVVYDISSLAFDTPRAISLFMQTLVIASLLGFVVFYFMYHLIEYPLRSLNQQLDEAMRTKTEDIRLRFDFPIFQKVVANVNSLLTRASAAETGGPGLGQPQQGFEQEAQNLVKLMMLPCAAISSAGTILSCNSRFEQFARRTTDQMLGQPYSSIGDAALHQNMEHLILKSQENPFGVYSDQLDFSGQACQIHAQAFTTGGSIDYILIVITPDEGVAE